MRNTLFIILTMFVAAPSAATNDEPATQNAGPTVAVEIMPLEYLPIAVEIPSSVQEMPAVETAGCFRKTRENARHLVPYTLIVGIAMELPYELNLTTATGALTGAWIGCKIKKARSKD